MTLLLHFWGDLMCEIEWNSYYRTVVLIIAGKCLLVRRLELVRINLLIYL